MGLGKRKRIIGLAIVAVVAGTLVVAWRLTGLDGLPDVGDPFDVSAFADGEVPNDRNAFTLYEHAKILLTGQLPGDATYDWATAGAAEKAWLAANREALDFWRRGTDRPEALYHSPRTVTFGTLLAVIQDLRTFANAACLEGTRLEAAGDMDGALTWYLAILRSGRHCGTRGCTIERLFGIAINNQAIDQLDRWASDPRVNAAMLRRAIDAALAAEAMNRPISETLKVEYLMLMNSLNDPKLMAPEVYQLATGKDASMRGDTRFAKATREDIPRIFKREPERSRRVIRLIYANRLASCDLPSDQKPPVAATIPPDYVEPPVVTAPDAPWATTRLVAELHDVGPSAPAAARALPAAEIALWWDSTLYAKACMRVSVNFPRSVAAERAAQASLLANLRAELAKREHPQPIGAKPGADRP